MRYVAVTVVLILLICLSGCIDGKKPKKQITESTPNVHDGALRQRAMAELGKAETLMGENKFSEAIMALQSVLQLQPSFAEAHAQLANAYRSIGRTEDAVKAFNTAVSLRVVNDQNRNFWAYAQTNFGYALAEMKDMKGAAQQFRQVIEVMPTFSVAYRYLGSSYMEMADIPNAIKWFSRGLKVNPTDDHSLFQLANCYNQLGDADNAKKAFLETIRVKPTMAGAYVNLGTLHQKRKELKEAIEMFRQGIQIDPKLAAAYTNLGIALQDTEQIDEAVKMCEHAVNLDPKLAAAYNNYGRSLEAKDNLLEAKKNYFIAVQLQKEYVDAYCGLAFIDMTLCFWQNRTEEMTNVDRYVRSKLAQQGRVEKQQCVQPFRGFPYDISPQLHLDIAIDVIMDARRLLQFQPSPSFTLSSEVFATPKSILKIGYLSSDFGAHTVGSLMRHVFTHHNRSLVKVYGFAIGNNDRSEWRIQMEHDADEWVNLSDKSDWEAALQIVNRQVHILIDLNGHSKGSRPGIILRRPTPSVITWLGYPSTSGGLADALVGDRIVTPPEHQSFSTERLFLTANSYFITDHPHLYPRPFPVLEETVRSEYGLPPPDTPIIGSFGQVYKIEPKLFDIWCRIALKSKAQLWLLQFPSAATPQVLAEAAHRKLFPNNSSNTASINMTPLLPLKNHIAIKALADVALDTLLFNAHSTGADTMWAGLPLITLPGDRMAARAGASFAWAFGDTTTVARTLQEYEQLALM